MPCRAALFISCIQSWWCSLSRNTWDKTNPLCGWGLGVDCLSSGNATQVVPMSPIQPILALVPDNKYVLVASTPMPRPTQEDKTRTASLTKGPRRTKQPQVRKSSHKDLPYSLGIHVLFLLLFFYSPLLSNRVGNGLYKFTHNRIRVRCSESLISFRRMATSIYTR